ncbi:PR domain zinc finger protein 10-like [Tubulanus polymorphus]|uniref:PR domain zinc finger protein 10-like n=1 Tax=Tubulanus polymorphus TaxID=672921 RepID=UPI003DA67F34
MDGGGKERSVDHLTSWANQSQNHEVDYQVVASTSSSSSSAAALNQHLPYTSSHSFVQTFSQAHFVHDGQYDAVTSTYRIGNETYQLATPVSEVYQPPHSTYERVVSPDEDGYPEASTSSDTLQQLHTLQPDDAAQMVTIQMDRNALQRTAEVMGYPMQVLLQERRQTDSPMSSHSHSSQMDRNQSPMRLVQSNEAQSASHLMQLAQQSHNIYSPAESTVTQASVLPSLMNQRGIRIQVPAQHSFTSQAEVASSSGLGGHQSDEETDQAVSSISLSFHHQQPILSKVHTLSDNFSAEPDTTGEELTNDLEPHQSTGHSPVFANQTDEHSLDSTVNTCHLLPSSSHLVDDGVQMIQGNYQSYDNNPQLVSGGNEIYDNSLVLVDPNDQVSQSNQPMEIPVIETRELRKSARLTYLEEEQLKYVPRPHYDPTVNVYNQNEIWCEDCMKTYTNECPYHKLTLVLDKVVLSRAWASLPSILQIFRLGDSADLGVFAKKSIPKNTQFGPFVASIVDSEAALSRKDFILKIDDYQSSGETVYLETSDENKCNWMMFIRPSQSYAEQNLVVYQYGSELYFTVCKQIDARSELKVWYAAHYAHHIGAAVHNLTKEEQEALDQAENKWPCFECNQRFKTSALLQHHLLEHDDDNTNPSASILNPQASTSGEGDSKSKKDGSGSAHSSFQNWKKKKTNIFLNKHLKKVKYGNSGGETSKRPMKSLFKKKESKVNGGAQEWVCTNCDLTFDNPSLLNLHTLTHAAENVGLEEIKFLAGEIANIPAGMENMDLTGDSHTPEGEDISTLGGNQTMECPVCKMLFTSKLELIDHASTHGKAKKPPVLRPYKCSSCWKAFRCEESLHKHLLCHGSEDAKPLQCVVCLKRFMNNSALSCHMKTHSSRKYYMCPVCREEFDVVSKLREHTVKHEVNGQYPCPECPKIFAEFNQIRKHMRAFHSQKSYPCPECPKVFPRPDKLKLHLLRHSSHREFMCELCGRQFKRKDKLKEHTRRMHTAEREEKNTQQKARPGKRRFTPKVSPSDYHRFIYKCHTCLLGFKRRGMLVNHLAKRHPDVKPETVPELNLPILRTQRDYYCQYCDKVYKSSSKRKSHILKNHPGAELPVSGRKKDNEYGLDVECGTSDGTYSQPVGSVTTVPHPCECCHKQYASKAKLMQHQRKKHPGLVAPPKARRILETLNTLQMQHLAPMPDELPTVQQVHVQGLHDLQAADLLTQAMSELTQSMNDFRQQPNAELQVPRQATLVQPGGQTTTIEFTQLGAALAQFQPQAGAVSVTPVANAGQQMIHFTGTTSQQDGSIPQSLTVPVSIQPIPQQQKWPSYTYTTTR